MSRVRVEVGRTCDDANNPLDMEHMTTKHHTAKCTRAALPRAPHHRTKEPDHTTPAILKHKYLY